MISHGFQTLANGVRVVVDPMPSLETAAFGVWAHAGSIDERQEEHGVAHLLEHMAFKGTGRRSARAIVEEIESVGGYLNAATSHQRTGYYARTLKEDVALAMDIIADILSDPLFAETELAKEQEVVVQEIGEAADTPDDVVFERLMEVAWEGDVLARPILGTPDTVRAQTPSSLRGFMKRCYGPQDMVMAVAGNVDADAFLNLSAQHFGGASSRDARPRRSAPEFRGGVFHDERDIEQTHLALAFPGVSSRDDDFFAARIFADVLGGGMSSRLFQKIREDRGIAYSVYAFADAFEQCGLMGVYLGADADQIGEACGIIRAEMEALADGAEQDEIDRARALLRASLMMGLENPAARIETAVGQLFTFDRLMAPDEILEKLNAVTRDDIVRCAQRALDGRAAIAMVGPGDVGDVQTALGG